MEGFDVLDTYVECSTLSTSYFIWFSQQLSEIETITPF